MNSFLLNRQLGTISPQSFATAQNDRLLRSLQATPKVDFSLEAQDRTASDDGVAARTASAKPPHAAGVNSIAIDRFEGRYLLSAGADSSVAIWDLEAATATDEGGLVHTPLGQVSRTSTEASSLGITQISYYPFDSLAFLISAYDRTLKLCSSETLQPSATFDLGSIVHSHATSTVTSSDLLVACATQHPAVRLVDLRSGSSTHSLAGHAGSVLSVAWHPRDAHILVSGATDGCVRVWDVRRSASSLGVLDLEDSIGIGGYDNNGTGARSRERGKSHSGAVNGVVWSEDGSFLVSVGYDERMRVWDMVTGANTLANFGPGLKNASKQSTSLFPLLAPTHLTAAGRSVVFYPNPKEILSFDLHAGTLLSRLRVTAQQHQAGSDTGGSRNVIPRTTSLAWRAGHMEMYSAHADGGIRCWAPRTSEDRLAEEEVRMNGELGEESDENERKRKREELEQIVKDLSGKRVTYS